MINTRRIIKEASNVKECVNPPFAREDFFAFYPQFSAVDQVVLDALLEEADAVVKKCRYHSKWKRAMCLYIAHFSMLYMMSTISDDDATDSDVIAAGELKGRKASKSVGAVSVSYDYSATNNIAEKYSDWTTTEYGAEFIQLAKSSSLGGMYIW